MGTYLDSNTWACLSPFLLKKYYVLAKSFAIAFPLVCDYKSTITAPPLLVLLKRFQIQPYLLALSF